MKPENCVLKIENLRVDRGGIRVLDIPSFSIRENEFVSLIGPNGSGKTTLLLSIMCLLKRVHGRIIYKGKEIDSRQSALEMRRRIAMVLQEPLLFDATVYENVASGLKLRGMGAAETRTRVMTYLERFNLADMAGRHARKLSGGEARRVSLARSFAVEPDMIFFDEPFANLDPPTRQALTEDMEKIIRETGISAILVTHDQSEALRLSDRIMVMNSGRIVQTGVPSLVMNNPINEFVANFVGMETILEGKVVRNDEGLLSVSVSGKEVDAIGNVSPGDAVYCCIRPENVTVSTIEPDRQTSARNIFRAIILGISSMGPFLKVTLDCGFVLVSYVTREAFTTLELYEGKEVYASFKATSVHLVEKPK